MKKVIHLELSILQIINLIYSAFLVGVLLAVLFLIHLSEPANIGITACVLAAVWNVIYLLRKCRR
jgi:hypothetical protein